MMCSSNSDSQQQNDSQDSQNLNNENANNDDKIDGENDVEIQPSVHCLSLFDIFNDNDEDVYEEVDNNLISNEINPKSKNNVNDRKIDNIISNEQQIIIEIDSQPENNYQNKQNHQINLLDENNNYILENINNNEQNNDDDGSDSNTNQQENDLQSSQNLNNQPNANANINVDNVSNASINNIQYQKNKNDNNNNNAQVKQGDQNLKVNDIYLSKPPHTSAIDTNSKNQSIGSIIPNAVTITDFDDFSRNRDKLFSYLNENRTTEKKQKTSNSNDDVDVLINFIRGNGSKNQKLLLKNILKRNLGFNLKTISECVWFSNIKKSTLSDIIKFERTAFKKKLNFQVNDSIIWFFLDQILVDSIRRDFDFINSLKKKINYILTNNKSAENFILHILNIFNSYLLKELFSKSFTAKINNKQKIPADTFASIKTKLETLKRRYNGEKQKEFDKILTWLEHGTDVPNNDKLTNKQNEKTNYLQQDINELKSFRLLWDLISSIDLIKPC